MKKITAVAGLLFLFLFGYTSMCAQTTKGKELWVSFMDNLAIGGNGPAELSFLISSDVNTAGVVSIPVTGFAINFTVTAGQVTEVILPPAILPFYAVGSEHIDSMAFLITANDSITVTAYHQRSYFSDASIVLPTSELGDYYMVMTHSDDYFSITQGQSQFVVEATEDNTTIDITPTVLTLGGRPPGVLFSVVLNKGNTYQVQSDFDLTGTTIKARDGKKIAVFSGSRTAGVGCSYADNHLYDVNYPVVTWGMDYMVCPFYVQSNIFRILAAENQTDVYINCNHVVTLDKGEYFDTLLGIPVHISSTRAVAVGQFERGSDCSFQIGDPNFLMYKPLTYVATKRTFNALVSTLPNNVFPYHFVTVFVKTAHLNLVLLDNVAAASSFSAVPANPAYSFGVIDLTGGTHTLGCDSGFYAFVTGFRNYDAYSYFLGYDDFRTSDSLFLQITSDSLCMNMPIQFSGTAASGSPSWTWDFGDGTSSSLQNPEHTYTSAGTYHVTLAAIDASGCPYSTEQTVVIEDCTPPPLPEPECEIFVPNAFSPNGDGQNDVLCVRGWCIASMDFSIYDRWGTLVFSTTVPSECWDGTYRGIALESAVFVYSLNATLVTGEVVVKKGNVSLIR